MFAKFIPAMLLSLLLSTAVLAVEPAKSPAPPSPAASAPAAQQSAPMTASQPAGTQSVKATPASAPATPTKVKPNRAITITMFMAIIGVTLGVVVWAAKRTTSAADFYAAGGGITGLQNGWAIAGDYMSAASFLGMSGLISLYGIDGFMYAVGPMFSFIAILLVVAEPCRNAGKFTLGDILSFRAAPKTVRGVAAISTVTVSLFYLIAQMVGAGKLMQVLLDIPYRVSVIGVGVLMVGYVVFG
ncbi:cation acetate symporter, partial [bacterium]|nr:cation acetate symporter [bacterium]